MGNRHCPKCDGEVVIWNTELGAHQCLDCGESWSIEEEEAVRKEFEGEEQVETSHDA